MTNKTGLWNYTPPEIEITTVHYDACGKSDDREWLNDEYVVITNSGVTLVSLYLWKLEDEANHYYLFPDMVIEPEQNITVHTSTGSDNSTCSGTPVIQCGTTTTISLTFTILMVCLLTTIRGDLRNGFQFQSSSSLSFNRYLMDGSRWINGRSDG